MALDVHVKAVPPRGDRRGTGCPQWTPRQRGRVGGQLAGGRAGGTPVALAHAVGFGAGWALRRTHSIDPAMTTASSAATTSTPNHRRGPLAVASTGGYRYQKRD
jgi:hypothetical protein